MIIFKSFVIIYTKRCDKENDVQMFFLGHNFVSDLKVKKILIKNLRKPLET